MELFLKKSIYLLQPKENNVWEFQQKRKCEVKQVLKGDIYGNNTTLKYMNILYEYFIHLSQITIMSDPYQIFFFTLKFFSRNWNKCLHNNIFLIAELQEIVTNLKGKQIDENG